MRRQEAVWWERTSSDHYGRFSFNPPVQVTCRWDDEIVEYVDAGGETRGSRAVVYVDRIMSPGDRLRRGEMASDEPLDPLSIPDAYEVRRFDQNPNLRNSETLLTAYL